MITLSEILAQLPLSLSDVSAVDIIPLISNIRRIKLEGNEAYVREGDTARKLAYIESGMMRAYTFKDNGDEATLFIRWEGQIVASHDAIIHRQPARFIYRALEPTTLNEIDYDVLEEVLATHPQFEPLRNFFSLQMLADCLDMMESFVMYTPEERYRRLLAERGKWLSRVPDKYIASMLGITPVSLSRLRKRIQMKDKT